MRDFQNIFFHRVNLRVAICKVSTFEPKHKCVAIVFPFCLFQNENFSTISTNVQTTNDLISMEKLRMFLHEFIHKKNGQPIKDWKASVRTWARREKEFRKNATEGNGSRPVTEPPKYKEFGPEPKIDAVEMPDDIRRSVNKILKEA